MATPRRWLALGAALVIGLASGCSPEPTSPAGALGSTGPTLPPLAVVVQQPVGARDSPKLPDVYRRLPSGVLLPNTTLSPGSAYADVGIKEICLLHYTMGIRKPRFNTKVDTLKAYRIPLANRASYQLDHVIPLSLGGDNTPANLWPQPLGGQAADLKDRVEARLHSLVCAKRISLVKAQRAISINWWQAYRTYGAVPATKPDRQPNTGSEVVNGWACPREGVIGYTVPKHVPLRCSKDSSGDLHWTKRS